MKVDFGNGVTVREMEAVDIEPFAKIIRKQDADEVWASHHYDPLKAASLSFYNSPKCYIAEYEDKILCIFGIAPDSLISNSACAWFLGTIYLEKFFKKMVRYSPWFLKLLHNNHAFLYNWVDSRNTLSVKWLKWLGAEMSDPEPYGEDKLPFHRFIFKRKVPCIIT